jgi:hypothetical protein
MGGYQSHCPLPVVSIWLGARVPGSGTLFEPFLLSLPTVGGEIVLRIPIIHDIGD